MHCTFETSKSIDQLTALTWSTSSMGHGHVFITQGSVEGLVGSKQTKTRDISTNDIKVIKLHAFASATGATAANPCSTEQILSKRCRTANKAASIQIRSMASSDQHQRLNEDNSGKKPLGHSDPFTCVKLLFSGEWWMWTDKCDDPTSSGRASCIEILRHSCWLASTCIVGAMTAVVSRTCVAPLERIKMELMVWCQHDCFERTISYLIPVLSINWITLRLGPTSKFLCHFMLYLFSCHSWSKILAMPCLHPWKYGELRVLPASGGVILSTSCARHLSRQ